MLTSFHNGGQSQMETYDRNLGILHVDECTWRRSAWSSGSMSLHCLMLPRGPGMHTVVFEHAMLVFMYGLMPFA